MRCSASVSKSFFSICRVCPWKSPQKLSCRSRTNTSNRCVLFFTRIVGVGSFTGDLLVAQQTYTLSLFTHPKLRHPGAWQWVSLRQAEFSGRCAAQRPSGRNASKRAAIVGITFCEENRHGDHEETFNVAWHVPIPARAAHRICRTTFHERAHGACSAPGGCDEWHLSACTGCHLGRGETAANRKGDCLLGRAPWHLCKLACHDSRGNFRYGSSVSNHSGRPYRSTLARKSCDGWFHECRRCDRRLLVTYSMGPSGQSIAVNEPSHGFSSN